MSAFEWSVRVYWEDTDAGGVVYHARYLQFLERTRTEWLRSCGYEQGHLSESIDMVFAVRNMNLDFLKPAKLDDLLTVRITLSECRRASFTVWHELWRGEELLLTGTSQIACLSATRFKPRPIPEPLLSLINQAGVHA
jgi:acyl-CoA thioester hydrolase